MKLSEIIVQLESCGYTCEAGPLERNVAFVALKGMASGEGTGHFFSRFKYLLMRMLILGFLLIPFFAAAQLQKFEFEPVSENEFMAITWIVEDSIISHDEVLILPLASMNQSFNGCMCAIKTDSLRQKAAIICFLTKGKTFRELSSKAEKDMISATRKDFAFSIKSDDPSLFWWSIE